MRFLLDPRRPLQGVFAFAITAVLGGAALPSLGCLPAQPTDGDDVARSEHAWDETPSEPDISTASL